MITSIKIFTLNTCQQTHANLSEPLSLLSPDKEGKLLCGHGSLMLTVRQVMSASQAVGVNGLRRKTAFVLLWAVYTISSSSSLSLCRTIRQRSFCVSYQIPATKISLKRKKVSDKSRIIIFVHRVCSAMSVHL